MKGNIKEKYYKYLPSKKFRKVIIFVLIALFIVSIFLFATKKESFLSKKSSTLIKAEGQTLDSLLRNDSDRDGIVDWEEALWGTDKNKKSTFGIPDMEYIQKKKDELKIEQEENDKTMSETDKFAREFFAAYSAMNSSGFDENTINNFSNALGAEVGNPELPNMYTDADLKTTNTNNEQEFLTYYKKIQDLFSNYQEKYSLGDELEIVSDGLITYSSEENTSNVQYQSLYKIGEGYKDFAYEATKINVPKNIAPYHLQIINSAHNTGLSVLNMTKVINDPVVGVSGLAQYQKYSKDLTTAVENLEDNVFGIYSAGNYLYNNEGTQSEKNNDTIYFGGDINQ